MAFDVGELKGNGIGKAMFNDALNYFGDKLKGINGVWVEGDNPNAFKKAVGAGMSEAEAAFQTWTGATAKSK